MTATVSGAVAAQHDHARASLPFDDTADFDAATRGFLGTLDPPVVHDSDGRVVWDLETYSFLEGEAPETVNPSLWRQSQLLIKHGLFEVVPGIYQVRGFDLSVMTLIEGETGVVVVDPLISCETAAAGLALYRKHRGDRPVTGMIYTHSHADHFGGAKGVTTQAEVDSGRVRVLAPEGFLEHAIAENVYAGTAMARRAGYMYGAALDRGPLGQVGAGLAQTTSTGTFSMIPPTVAVTGTGQVEVVDGVRLVFQLAPGTEAPAELHFHLPDHRALCTAENATRTLHNILTIRGALVRDPHDWAGYLTEMIEMFGNDTDVAFASHHWPTWGHDEVIEYLTLQRDLYAYLHDQTLRMLNAGMVGSEIAEAMELPPALERAWHARGYYGSVSHNVGDLPALHGLVRRQPRQPLAAPAGGAGPPLRRRDGRSRRSGGHRKGGVRRGRPPVGCRNPLPRCLRRTRPRRGPSTARRLLRAARVRLGERAMAVRLPLRSPRTPRGRLRYADQPHVQ